MLCFVPTDQVLWCCALCQLIRYCDWERCRSVVQHYDGVLASRTLDCQAQKGRSISVFVINTPLSRSSTLLHLSRSSTPPSLSRSSTLPHLSRSSTPHPLSRATFPLLIAWLCLLNSTDPQWYLCQASKQLWPPVTLTFDLLILRSTIQALAPGNICAILRRNWFIHFQSIVFTSW